MVGLGNPTERKSCVSDDQPDVNVDAYLSEAITVLDVVAGGEYDVGTVGEYAQRLDMLRLVISKATDLRNALEVVLAEAMPESRMTEGGLRISRERSTRSYWKDAHAGERMREDIEHKVATTLATDVATGDINLERRNIISHALHELWDVLPAPSSLKAGARRYDLRVSDYREFTPGYNIRITPVEEVDA
jgi:hypothetical protein